MTPHRVSDRTAYCADCKGVRPVKRISGLYGARDQLECLVCERRWQVGRGT